MTAADRVNRSTSQAMADRMVPPGSTTVPAADLAATVPGGPVAEVEPTQVQPTATKPARPKPEGKERREGKAAATGNAAATGSKAAGAEQAAVTKAPTAAELRAEIAATRADLGATVAALVARADVRSRTQEAVTQRISAIKASTSETAHRVKDTAGAQARRPLPWIAIAAMAAAVTGVIVWRRRR